MTIDAHRLLPLKPTELQLLLALSERELHGYGLTQAIAESSAGVITLEPGNLYRVIKRLLAADLVAESVRRPAPELGADERRIYYRLTPLGARVLAAELHRLRSIVTSPTGRTLIKRWAR